jgi:hypothetical protein
MNQQAHEHHTPAPAPAHDTLVDKITVKFSFKKVTTKDEVSGVETEYKRPTVELNLPLLSVEGAVAAFNAGEKQLDLILESLRDVQIARAREIINENESITAENFPYHDISWESIANLPPAQRRGGGISKETWEDFVKDYIAVMPAVTGKSLDKIALAAKILTSKFQTIRTNKPVIGMIKGQLDLYTVNSPNAEQFAPCIEFLQQKADALLKLSDEALLENL